MRVEVYGNREDDSVLRLRLVEAVGRVDLIAVDTEGAKMDCGYILYIRNDGVLVLRKGVNSRLGLQLDESGCVRLEVEE